MEERVKILVENTFNNFDIEECKQVIVDRILWYEMRILQQEQRIEELEDMINNSEDFKTNTLAFDIEKSTEQEEKMKIGFRKE